MGWLPLEPLDVPGIFAGLGIFIFRGCEVFDRRPVIKSESDSCPALKEFKVLLDVGGLLALILDSDGVCKVELLSSSTI